MTFTHNHQKPTARHPRYRSNWWYLLVLIPVIALLYTPWYAHVEPTLFGLPFFLWYQFAWVFGGVATTLAVSHLGE